MKHPRPILSSVSAFSVTELLVSIGMIAVLATLGMAAFQSSTERGRDVQCVANLRQIGVGLAGYTTEHNHRLPGPLQASQGPRYNRVSGEIAAYLASYIAKYIGIPEAASGPLPSLEQARQQAPMFYCPAFGKAVNHSFPNTYFMRWRVEGSGTSMPPWGNYGTITPQTPRSLLTIPSPATTWAVSDLDRLCPNLPPESWVARIPTRPVHGPMRNALFFDWHVGKISADSL